MKAEWRRSFGTCFRSSNMAREGPVGSTKSTKSGASTRMAKSWNQDRDWGRFLLSERKSGHNPKLQRRTAAQDRTPLVYDWDLIWDIIMTLLHSPMSHRRPGQLLLNRASTTRR